MARTGLARSFALAAVASSTLAGTAARAVTFTVDSTADEVDDNVGNGLCHTASNRCTLRAAVMEGNKSSGVGATIVLPQGTYTFVIPASGANGPENGDLNLTTPESGDPLIAISGAGAGATIIDGAQLDRVFYLHASRTATISGVTLRNGFADEGGGIYAEQTATLTLEHVDVVGNTADFNGGGILNHATLTVRKSTLSGNSADYGGGINAYAFTEFIQSTITENVASVGGGGISNHSTLFVTNTTISGNHAAAEGGGIRNPDGTVNTYNSTIAFNEADSDGVGGELGGGIFNQDVFNIGDTVVAGNLVAGGTFPNDCAGAFSVYRNNKYGYVDDDNCFLTQVGPGSATALGSLAELGPLTSHGGSTETHAIVAPSGMIDGAEPTLGCRDRNGVPITVDQRGGARGALGLCDLGAYELGALDLNLIFADGFEAGNSWAWG